MNDFLLVKFSIDREYNELMQLKIYDYDNIGIEIDDPIEMKMLLSELPEWEISDIEVKDSEKIKYSIFFEDSKKGILERDRFVSFLKEEFPNTSYSSEYIDNSNWEEEWKKSYKSFEIGNNIIVKPSWEEKPITDKIIIEIDPKMAFGTGTHETTSLIMEAIELFDLSNLSILDIGCGSGILSILAKKLGAKSVDACDIDEIAINSTRENALINDVEINAFLSDLFSNVDGIYDIIFANILAEVLVKVIEDANKYLHEDGIIFLSGIIREKEDLIIRTLIKNNFQMIDLIRKGEWSLISARRKDA